MSTALFPVQDPRVAQILQGTIATMRIPNGLIIYGRLEHTYPIAVWFACALNDNAQRFTNQLTSENCPDFRVIAPDPNSIGVAAIKEIHQLVQYGPLENSWKIIVIKQADRLTEDGANAFLKLLEEPPTGVVFLLLAEKEKGILPTIKSRCQIIESTVKLEPHTNENNQRFWEQKTLDQIHFLLEMVEEKNDIIDWVDEQLVVCHEMARIADNANNEWIKRFRVLQEMKVRLDSAVNKKLWIHALICRLEKVNP